MRFCLHFNCRFFALCFRVTSCNTNHLGSYNYNQKALYNNDHHQDKKHPFVRTGRYTHLYREKVSKEYSDHMHMNVGESHILWRSESLHDDDCCGPGYRVCSHRHVRGPHFSQWSLSLDHHPVLHYWSHRAAA